jgi:hypothetical protein
MVQIIGDLPILVALSSNNATATINNLVYCFSWIAMASGFSLVLYSRLHLVLPNPKMLRIILFVILVDGIIVQAPLLIVGAVYGKIGPATFVKAAHIFTYYEVLLSVQEASLSSLYIFLFVRFIRQGDSQSPKETKKVLYLLVAAEVTIILCDLASNTLLYLQVYFARRIIFTFVFAIKLRVEFAVLNRLAIFGQQRMQAQDGGIVGQVGVSRSLFCDQPEHPENFRNSQSPLSAVMGSTDGMVEREDSREGLSTTHPEFTPIGSHGIGTQGRRPLEKDSMEELERRYLGRFGTVDIV